MSSDLCLPDLCRVKEFNVKYRGISSLGSRYLYQVQVHLSPLYGPGKEFFVIYKSPYNLPFYIN